MCTRLKRERQRDGNARQSLQCYAVISDNLRETNLIPYTLSYRPIDEMLFQKNLTLLHFGLIKDTRVKRKCKSVRTQFKRMASKFLELQEV